jgi:hypothetical protein
MDEKASHARISLFTFLNNKFLVSYCFSKNYITYLNA